MSQLTIETENTDAAETTIIVKLMGEGHVGDGPQLAEAFDAVLAQNPRLVVADLSGLVFASSITMGALVKLRGQLKQNGGSLRMAALTAEVGDAFHRARLDWTIPTFETVEQALAVG